MPSPDTSQQEPQDDNLLEPVVIRLFGPVEVTVGGKTPSLSLAGPKLLLVELAMSLAESKPEIQIQALPKYVLEEGQESTLAKMVDRLDEVIGKGRVYRKPPVVGLKEENIQIDYVAFRRAYDRQDWANAVKHYGSRGHLFDGTRGVRSGELKSRHSAERDACVRKYAEAVLAYSRQLLERIRDETSASNREMLAEEARALLGRDLSTGAWDKMNVEEAARIGMEIEAEMGSLQGMERHLRFATDWHESQGTDIDPETTLFADTLRKDVQRRRPTLIRGEATTISRERAAPYQHVPSLPFEPLGRQRDVELLTNYLLVGPEYRGPRLVSLVGPAGVGKTTVALQVLPRLRGHYADGIWYVDLAAVEDSEQVTSVIAETLEVKEPDNKQGRLTLEELVLERLEGRHVLLVLNNCEQVLTACAVFAQRALRRCGEVWLLVTSQYALAHPAMEQTVHLRPLPTLLLNERMAAELPAPQELIEDWPAIRLFVECRARLTDFSLTEGNALDVIRICEELDGLPLALEFAAAQVGYAVGELAKALHGSERFDILTAGTVRDPSQHQGLRRLLEWTWNNMPENGYLRSVFCALSVVQGRFSNEVADILTAALGVNRQQTRDALTWLKSASFVRNTDSEDEHFFLRTYRLWGLEKLREAGRKDDVYNALLRLACEMSEAYCRAVGGAKVSEMLYLDRHYDVIRTGLSLCLSEETVPVEERAGAGLTLCAYLWNFWKVRNRWYEGLQWLNRFFAVPLIHEWEAAARQTDAVPEGDIAIRAALLADARNGAGLLAAQDGDFEQALQHLLISVELARWIGDVKQEADSLGTLGYLCWRATQGGMDLYDIVPYDMDGYSLLQKYDEAMVRFPERAPAAELAKFWPLFGLGRSEGEGRYRQAMELAVKYQENELEAMARGALGEIARERGDIGVATEEHLVSLSRSQSLKDWGGMANSFESLAKCGMSVGDLEAALAFYALSRRCRQFMDRMPEHQEDALRYPAFDELLPTLGEERVSRAIDDAGNLDEDALLSYIPPRPGDL